MSKSTQGLRRSTRLQTKQQQAVTHANVPSDEDESNTTKLNYHDNVTDDNIHIIEEQIHKPAELFFDNDISGQQIYSFKTPSKKNSMTVKANKCRTPASVKVPSPKLNPKVMLERLSLEKYSIAAPKMSHKKTSTNVPIIQRRYTSEISSSESESISELSDYNPSSSESDDDILSTSTDLSEEDSDKEVENTKAKVKKTAPIPQSKPQSTHKKQNDKHKSTVIYKDYHLKSDRYFEVQSEKAVTSDRTLERLQNARLTKEKLEELLASQNSISSIHKKHICSMTEGHTSLFRMWLFVMDEGYTVLLHGVGSKRCLINDFHKTMTADHPTLVVNGFFPSLTIKDILDGIIIDLLNKTAPASTAESLNLIETTMRINPTDRLYMLIHNIDGIMLRSAKAQETLSSLAGIPNLCVLASVDHINSPLLWDHVKRSKFNFCWWDATTFLPYREETSYESSLLVQQSGALALSSLHNVFLSLTSNAKSIYVLLAQNQLSNSGNANFSGMAFRDLYRAAREGFLVSSDLVLRAQLTEFLDHKLVKTKRNIDGVEHLVIPLSNNLLKKFLDDQES